jgi:hypothetical protein
LKLGVSQLLICTYPHAALGFARFCKTDSLNHGAIYALFCTWVSHLIEDNTK